MPTNPLKKLLPSWLLAKPAHSLKEALADSRLQALKQNLKDALRFLRKTHLKSIFHHRKLPWYLVFGANDTGKTSLLARSGLSLVSTNQLPVQHITTTSYCQWFFGEEAVFIDVSGNLMLPENIDTATLQLWHKFLSLLQSYRHGYPLDGAILCVDLLNLQDKSFEQNRQYIDVLLHHIQALPEGVPIYILFTRCDRMQGFTEFFHTLSTEERDQICGVTLSPVEQQDFAQHVDEQLNHFLVRLNQQILAHIQRERDLQKRIRIKNFPLQLEAQKRNIVQLSNQLHSTKNAIKGIYFTSSQQEGIQSDALTPVLDTFGFPIPPNTSDRPLQKNTFFIKHALKKIIQHTSDTQKPSKGILQKLQAPLLIPKFNWIVGSLFLMLLSIMLASYFYNRQAIYEVKSIITDYQVQSKNHTQENPFALLNALYKGQSEVKYAANPLTGLVFHQASDLRKQLGMIYQQALDTTFVPYLEKTLETQLKADTEKNAPGLFDTLRVYLMMENPTHRDPHVIDAWFVQYVKTASADNQIPAEFAQHLHAWLAQASPTFKTDIQLVEAARQTLQKLQPQNLVYATLEQHNENNLLYDEKHFSTIYKQDIPALAKAMIENDGWVLGDSLPSNMSAALTSQLTDEVRQLYVTRYIAFWTAELSRLTVPQFKNLNEARLFARTVNTNRSLLLPSLKTVQEKLAPVATTTEGKQAIAMLEKTRALVADNQKNTRLNEALKKFIVYLDGILANKDTTQAIFAATQERMQNNHKPDAITQLIRAAKDVPEPLNNWFAQLGTNTWQNMLQTSQTHLNALWKTQVLPKYYAGIMNRYPVFADAKEEITLAAFSDFFGPSSPIDNFFKQNLSQFADTHAMYWQWKEVDGQRLNIPKSTLEMFNRAALIHKMYFADNKKIPSVKFSLTPVNVDLISENFVLNLGDQSVSYSTDFRQQKQITWPNQKSNNVALEIQTPTEKKVFYEEKGVWALFRLLTHAQLATSENPRLYQLEFKLDDFDVTYEVLASNPVNAFLPDIVTAFRCPEEL